MAIQLSTGAKLFDANLAAAGRGNAKAYFELGVAYSTGTDGVAVDLIEAHKWFNLAALAGMKDGSSLRAEIAAEMDKDEIAEAQRQARAWIATLNAPSPLRDVA